MSPSFGMADNYPGNVDVLQLLNCNFTSIRSKPVGRTILSSYSNILILFGEGDGH